jgi:hypothetical protein
MGTAYHWYGVIGAACLQLSSSSRGVMAQQPEAAAAAAEGEWYHIAYVQTTGGFDDHDTRGSAAMCSVSGGAVHLKGTAQCVMNVANCMSKPQTAFGTLPPECGPVGPVVVQLASGERAYEVPAGTQLHVSPAGRLTLDAPLPGKWMVRLDNTAIPRKSSSWGWEVVFVLAAGAGIYVAGGILYTSMARGRPLRLRSHPHWSIWLELRSLCADGAAHARAQAMGRTSACPGGRHHIGLLSAEPQATHSKHRTSAHKDKQKRGKASRTNERTRGASETGDVATADGVNSAQRVIPVDGSSMSGSAAAGGGRWVKAPS